MPLPFILAGVALAAGGYGLKKGIDAVDNYNTADYYNDKAKKIYNEAKEKLSRKKKSTNKHLETLGEVKISIYKGSLNKFASVFSRIKNVDFKDRLQLGLLDNIDAQDILDIKDIVIKLQEVVGGAVAAIGSGALAGFGAWGGVGALATASTGTAIASLSGAAATNATLAWLGGGSLAAGGFGMTGGMVVLGGIVTGPVLAVGGMMLASKAEEAKHVAYENFDKAKAASEQIDATCVVLDAIYKRTDEFINILTLLDPILIDYNKKLENLVSMSDDYTMYGKWEKNIVMITSSIAKTVKNICDAPIIDKNGNITQKSKEVIETSKRFLEKIREV